MRVKAGQIWQVAIRTYTARVDQVIFLVLRGDVYSIVGLVLYSEHDEVVAGQRELFTTGWVEHNGSLLCETTVR